MRNAALTAAATVALAATAAAETYRGIEVAPERRCAPHDRGDYRYSQSVEARIVASIGQVYGPYTGRCFAGTGETDIEHMVATSGGPRQRPVRRPGVGEVGIRIAPAQPDPRGFGREQAPQRRQGRGRVDAG